MTQGDPSASLTTRPPTRDRDFERRIHDGYDRLVEEFIAEGFKRKEARLWVGAWRHTDSAAVLARYALAFHHLRVDVGRAVPWYWENIPPTVAVRFLPYRWRAAEARRVAQTLRGQDPTLTRREALNLALRWAESYWTPAESQELITLGYDLATADSVERHLERETLAHDLATGSEPSTLRQWAKAGIPPERVLRYLAAGVTVAEEARNLEGQRGQGGTDDLDDRLAVLAALRNGGQSGG